MLITEAAVTCLALIASLCVPDTAKADIDSAPGWVGAVITLGDVEVTSTISSDSIVSPYKKHMTTLCQDDHCIFYKGYCAKSESDINCLLWYSKDDMTELRKIEVRGKRFFAWLAMNRVKLAVSSDIMIPLSAFRYDAQDDSPPTCNARQGCVAD